MALKILSFSAGCCCAQENANRHVVIFCPVIPTIAEWRQISEISLLHFVQGSMHHFPDLRRAGIETADICVLLARSTKKHAQVYFCGSDADVVLTSMILRANCAKCNPNLRILSELNRNQYMKHLKDMPPGYELQGCEGNHIFELAYISGNVVGSTFLESLLCQAFFNPYIIAMVSSLTTFDKDIVLSTDKK